MVGAPLPSSHVLDHPKTLQGKKRHGWCTSSVVACMCLITRGSPIGDTRVTLRLTVGLARGPSVRGSWIAIDHRKLLLGDLWVSCGSFVGRQWARCGSPVGQQWVYGATSRVPRGGSQMDHPPVTREGLHVNDLKKLDSRPSRQCTILLL